LRCRVGSGSRLRYRGEPEQSFWLPTGIPRLEIPGVSADSPEVQAQSGSGKNLGWGERPGKTRGIRLDLGCLCVAPVVSPFFHKTLGTGGRGEFLGKPG